MGLVLISLVSYLLGSIPFSYLVARAYGKNLYQVGSGNIGAANVWRATGKIEAFLLALVGDLGKGILAIFLTQRFFPGQILPLALATFFVVAGHNWPIFLKFKGGRGLGPAAGILFYLNFKALLLIFLITFFSIFLVEILMRKGLKLEGNLRQKMKGLFTIFISQVLGRVIGILISAIVLFFLYPATFKIIFPAAILVGIKHIKRTKAFLEGKVV
jgi:acyl-phosphate glycerol 3-phosphate acyltransferase